MEAPPVSATSAVGGTEEGADGDDKANVIGDASPGWYGGMVVWWYVGPVWGGVWGGVGISLCYTPGRDS